MKDKSADQTIIGNAFYLGSLLGDYDLARAAIEKMPGDDHLLYDGLVKFAEGERKWKKPLKKYTTTNPDSAGAAFSSLMLNENFIVNRTNYLKLVSLAPSDAFKVLLHLKFREAEDFLPYFHAAETYCFNGNYARADEEFRLLERQTGLQIDDSEKDNINFYHAWTLLQLKRPDEALPLLEKLVESKDIYKKSATC